MTANDLIERLQSLSEEDRNKKVMLWDSERECNVDIHNVVYPCEKYDFTEIQQ